MTDQHDEAPLVGDGALEESDESSKSLSLMGGVARPEELPDAADLELNSIKPASKILTQGTMLIVAIFLIAAGTLYAMRAGHSEIQTSGEIDVVRKKIKDTLDRLSDPTAVRPDDPLKKENLEDLFKETDEIVEMFASDLTEQQVPPEYLKKNPFMLPQFRNVKSDKADEDQDQAKLWEAELKRMKALEKELGDLELQSVMQGAKPVAIINGEFYQPGDMIGSFKVKTIEALTVILEHKDQTYVLKMKD